VKLLILRGVCFNYRIIYLEMIFLRILLWAILYSQMCLVSYIPKKIKYLCFFLWQSLLKYLRSSNILKLKVK